MDLNEFFNLEVIEWSDAVLRIFLAGLFGLLIGMDREQKNKPIDFRAFMIISLAACMLAIIGQEFYREFEDPTDVLQLDLGKIIDGTLTGIGFLGAGAIIKHGEDQVVGTATGASIWASGGIGLSVGFGYYGLAALVTGAILIILVGLGYLRKASD